MLSPVTPPSLYIALKGLYILFILALFIDKTLVFCALIEASSLSMKGGKIEAFARRLWTDFEQGGIFIVQYLFYGTSVYAVSSEGPPRLVASQEK